MVQNFELCFTGSVSDALGTFYNSNDLGGRPTLFDGTIVGGVCEN